MMSTSTSRSLTLQDPCQGRSGSGAGRGVGHSSGGDESLTPPRQLPIDDLSCPLCGGDVEWRCLGDRGHAGCQDGGEASLRLHPERPPCKWGGVEVERIGGDVYVTLPIPTWTFEQRQAARRASRMAPVQLTTSQVLALLGPIDDMIRSYELSSDDSADEVRICVELALETVEDVPLTAVNEITAMVLARLARLDRRNAKHRARQQAPELAALLCPLEAASERLRQEDAAR